MAFLVKSIISRLLHPVPVLVCLVLAGLVLRAFPRMRRAGRIVHAAAVLLFLAFGFGLFNGALERLERTHPPFPGDDAAFCETLRGATVPVLGNGFATVDLPPRFRDNDCFRQRLSEGAFVFHCVPEARLLLFLSGGAPRAEKAAALRELAVTYGLDTNRVSFFPDARDTLEEAQATLRLAGTNRVVLVTSASHMPRAMRIFRTLGCEPVPAPCEYRFFGPNTQWRWYDWHFGAYNFDRADRLMHESFGLLREAFRRPRSRPSQIPTCKGPQKAP